MTQSFVETAKFLSSSTFDPPPYLRPPGGPYETTYTASFQTGRPYTSPHYSLRPLSRSFEFPSKILNGSSTGLEHLPYTAVTQRAIHKYTPQQWRTSNVLNVSSGEKERATAERLRDDCARLRTETALLTHRTQTDVNKKLEYRIHDITYWKTELEKQHAETVVEIKALQAFIGRLEKALAATEKPLNVSKQCLDYRERRVKIDLVHDNVETHISKVICCICSLISRPGASIVGGIVWNYWLIPSYLSSLISLMIFKGKLKLSSGGLCLTSPF